MTNYLFMGSKDVISSQFVVHVFMFDLKLHHKPKKRTG